MDQLLLYMFIYRTLIVLAGILCIYFGYKLFYVVKIKEGEIIIKTGESYEVSLRDVAPGVVFALFGAGILVFSLINGITITSHPDRTPDVSYDREYRYPSEPPSAPEPPHKPAPEK